VGVALLIQGGVDLAQRSDATVAMWVVGSLAVAAGISLVLGLLTPIAAALAVLWGASLVLLPKPNLFPSRLCAAFLTAVAAAVGLLGPGAFSLDARMFGLREIIIPPSRPLE